MDIFQGLLNNITSMTNESKKKVVILGAVVGGFFFLKNVLFDQQSIALQRENSIKKLKQPIKDERFILSVMRDLRGQLFSIWVQVADIYNKVLKENNNNPELEDGKLLSDVIFDEVQNLYLTKKRMICLKHQLEDGELEIYVDEIYSKNKEIQTIFQEIQQCFKMSMKGQYPNMDLDQGIFAEIPPEKTLFLVELILRETGKNFIKVYCDLRKNGEKDFSLQNKKFVDTIRDQKISEKKNQLLKQYGFDKYQDTPTEVLGKLSQNYRSKNIAFSQKLNRLEKQFDVLMETLTTQDDTQPDILEKIFGQEQIFKRTYQQYLIN